MVGPLAGLALGIAVPYLARWATELPWVPFEGPLRLAAFDSTLGGVGPPGARCAAGGRLRGLPDPPLARRQVSAEQIVIVEQGQVRRIPRADVVGIFRDGGKIVIEGHQGRRLFHGEVEGKDTIMREAFVQHGSPWEAE